MKFFRRLLRVLGLVICAIFGVAVCDAQSPPVRIMPLGDSLTSGTTAEGAYRNRLYNLLTTAGYNVDFVGTRADSINPTLPDRDHQGMGGYRIDQIQSGLVSWLDAIEDPDVVLLLIGTNDFSQNFNTGTAQNRLSALIADVATQRPFAKIIVSNLPLRTDNPTLEALQSAYNAAIPAIINDQVTLGRQVSFIDMHSVLSPGDFAEGVHPTVPGYDKMANAWFPAITSVISPTGTSNPPAIVRAEPTVDLQHVSIRFSKPLADSAANPANFLINGGLTISQAVLDPVSKRTITLTTSQQVPGALYTVAVNGIRDRTPQQNLISSGALVSFSSLTLANGSFESGQAGWSMTGNYLVYDTTPPYVASSGGKMVVLNGGQSPPSGVISQTFPTVPGQYYVLGYDVGFLAINNDELKLGVEVTGASSLFSRVDSVFGNSLGNSVWTGKTASFVADSSSTTLTFRDLSDSTDGRDLLLDNVRVSAAVAPVNAAPVALADSYSTNQNVVLVVPATGVLANDSDAESTPLTAVVNANPTHGTLVLNANGSFTYTPATGFSGTDSFTYHANDGALDSNIVSVNITVSAVTPGLLVNGSFEAGQSGWAMSGNFLVYDTNPPYAAFDGVKMVVFNGAQTAPNAVISQTFATVPGRAYVLDFNIGVVAGNFSEQKLGITVTGGAPLLSVTESVFGDGLASSVWTPKTHTFTADSNSTTLTFLDLSATSNGIDLLLDNVRVSAAVSPVNAAPVALADSYSTNQNVALVVPAAGVLANDSDAEATPLTAVVNANPTHGNLVLNADGSFTYTPATGFSGTDSFTYHASDGALDSNIVAVNITVSAVTSGLLVNGSFEAGQSGWAMSGNFLVYDSNPPYAAFDGVKMVVFNGAQTAPNAVISQTFATVPGRTYVLDFNIGVVAGNFSEQKLGITVAGGAPLLSVTESVFGNGQANSVWTPKTHTFTADSTSATLTFLDLSDTSNGIDLLLDNVRLRPSTVNSAPVAQGDSYSTNQGTALVVPAAGVLTNDSDAESDPLTAIVNANPSHGSLTLNANGGFSYTPAGNYTGPDSFSYHANDGNLDSAVVTVNISVLAVNSAPVAVADSYSTNQNSPLVILAAAGVLSNDSDAQLNTLTAVLNAGPSHGTLVLNGDGSFSYSPAPGYSGADSFSYHANDGLLDSNVVTVSIAVNATNTAPVASPDAYATNLDTPLVIPAAGVLANDADAQSNPIIAVLNAGPSHGTLTLNTNGGFTYTPAMGYSGVDSFTYHANDGSLDSNIVTVSLTVNGLISQVLVNGSFEANFTGWTVSGNQTIETYTARDGVKEVAFNSRNLTPNGILSQTFATVPGQTYALNFDAGILSYVKKQQQLSVTVNGSALLLSRTFVLNGAGGGSIRWTSKSYSFVADGTTATLAFYDQSSSTEGLDLLLDNVRVNGPPAFPNAAPVAMADSFAVNKDTVLVIPTTGVLLNDTDPQSDTLTAILDAGPTSGSLTLNATGGFVYRPNSGFTGTDSFTYHASDGSLNSNTVVVTISVNQVAPGILVNPSFEAGFAGWTASGNQTIESYPPTDGVKIVDFNSRNLTPNATLSQTFTTKVGQTYSLTFDVGVLAYSTDSQVLQVAVNGAANLLLQTITVNGVGAGITRWLPQSFTFVADSVSTTLAFSDQSTVTNGIDLLLDNVRILETTPVKKVTQSVSPPLPGTPSLSITPEAFVVSMTAPLPGNYVLERSADLKTWEIIDNMDCDAQDPIMFYDMRNAQDAGKPQMFYRIGCRSSQ